MYPSGNFLQFCSYWFLINCSCFSRTLPGSHWGIDKLCRSNLFCWCPVTGDKLFQPGKLSCDLPAKTRSLLLQGTAQRTGCQCLQLKQLYLSPLTGSIRFLSTTLLVRQQSSMWLPSPIPSLFPPKQALSLLSGGWDAQAVGNCCCFSWKRTEKNLWMQNYISIKNLPL